MSTQALREPRLTVFPNRRADYDGAPTSSDAGTLANGGPKGDYPGSGCPNQSITRTTEEVLTSLGVNGEPVPARGGRNPRR